MHECMWRLDHFGCHGQDCDPSPLKQGFSLAGSSPIRKAGCPVSPWDSLVYTITALGLQAQHHAQLFSGFRSSSLFAGAQSTSIALFMFILRCPSIKLQKDFSFPFELPWCPCQIAIAQVSIPMSGWELPLLFYGEVCTFQHYQLITLALGNIFMFVDKQNL